MRPQSGLLISDLDTRKPAFEDGDGKSVQTSRTSIHLGSSLLIALSLTVNIGCSESDSAAMTDQRLQLDKTVWKDEVVAQQFEQTFVRLWDELRASERKYDVLGAFPFDDLIPPVLQGYEPLEHGISRSRSVSAGGTLSRDAALAMLGELERSGIHIVETEWHHAAFTTGPDGTASSLINYTIHALRESASDRFVLRGSLQITWAPLDGGGSPRATRIDGSEMTVLHRQAAVAFQEVGKLVPPSRVVEPVLLADVDRNGMTDVVLAGANQLLLNDGGGRFRTVLLCDPVPGTISAAVLADLDGDGQLDLLAAGTKAQPLVYTQRRGDQFTMPRTVETVDPMDAPIVITVGDIDGDNDLDVWIAQYKLPYVGGQMPTPFYDANDGYPSTLMLNDGDARFTDGTFAAGLGEKRHRRTYAASFVDLDHDDDLDLIVVSDFSGLDVYLNDGSGHFVDQTSAWLGEGHNTFGMSHTMTDVDGDGLLDLLVVGMSSTTARRLDHLGLGREDAPDYQTMRPVMGYGNRLYLGRLREPYMLAPFTDAIARTGWSWGTTHLDLENDGDRDIYIVNGHLSGETCQDYCTTFWRHDLYDADSKPDDAAAELFNASLARVREGAQSWNGYEKNALFMNLDQGTLVNVGFLVGASFVYDSRAAAAGDLDGDGRVDLVVVERTRRPNNRDVVHIYRNVWSDPGHWLGIRLNGKPGLSPIGARISCVDASGRIHAHAVMTGDSHRAQHDTTVVFGLGDVTAVDHLLVHWPDGTQTLTRNPAIDRYHTLTPADP